MRVLTTFIVALALASCAKPVAPGEIAGGCVGLTEVEWNLLPKGAEIGINGTNIEWRLKRSNMKATTFPRGGFKLPNAPAGMAVRVSNAGTSAIIITKAKATVYWNNKVLKCKAA